MKIEFLTDPLMQRFKMTSEQADVSILMAVSTGASFDRQVFSAIESVVENLLASDWLQVVCIIWVQDDQTSAEGNGSNVNSNALFLKICQFSIIYSLSRGSKPVSFYFLINKDILDPK